MAPVPEAPLLDPDSPTLHAALAALGLAHEAPTFAPYADFELALRPDPTARSRIGGAPHVPPGFEWPCHRWPLAEIATWPDYARAEVAAALAAGTAFEADGYLAMPLLFLAQIDLAEANDPRLPDHGLLLFFASPTTDAPDPRYAKRVASAVRWVTGPLAPALVPPTADPPLSGTLHVRLERRLFVALPWEVTQTFLARVGPEAHAQAKAAWFDGMDALFAAPSEELTGPMPPEGEVALLRLHEHYELDFLVGDSSWLTFCVPEADLRARRFESASATVFIG